MGLLRRTGRILLNEEHFITFGKDQYHLNGSMEQWCLDQVGKGGWLYRFDQDENDMWGIKSVFGHTTFIFKDPKHLTMFLLRWS